MWFEGDTEPHGWKKQGCRNVQWLVAMHLVAGHVAMLYLVAGYTASDAWSHCIQYLAVLYLVADHFTSGVWCLVTLHLLAGHVTMLYLMTDWSHCIW